MRMRFKPKLQVNTFVVTQISAIKKSYIIHHNLTLPVCPASSRLFSIARLAYQILVHLLRKMFG